MRGYIFIFLFTSIVPLLANVTMEQLIDNLASRNDDPGTVLMLPSTYDQPAQTIVDDAIRELYNLELNAFPMLIEHLDDRRYCRSKMTSVYKSQSIGVVCMEIIDSQLSAGIPKYLQRRSVEGRLTGFESMVQNLYRDGKLANWLEARLGTDATLVQLRKEAVDWQIERETGIGFVADIDRERYLRPLQVLSKKLAVASGK